MRCIEFTVEPRRLVELAWPNILGTPFQSNDYWGDLITTPGRRPKQWVPSLYLGGLTLALAVSSLAIRRGPPWRVWLTAIAGISLLGSLGQYTSPIWLARALAVTSSSATVRNWLPDVGPFDPIDSMTIRHDGYLRDSDGGTYWWLADHPAGLSPVSLPGEALHAHRPGNGSPRWVGLGPPLRGPTARDRDGVLGTLGSELGRAGNGRLPEGAHTRVISHFKESPRFLVRSTLPRATRRPSAAWGMQ